MGLERSYNLKCDSCGRTHITTCETPRRARAVAKRDGWQRVQKSYSWWQDLCPACLDAMDEPPVP